MANVTLKLLATYYRLPAAGATGRTVYQGQEFETDPDNADRLVNAGAAERVTGADAKTDGTEGAPDPGAGKAAEGNAGASKPARKTAASKTTADTGGDPK